MNNSGRLANFSSNAPNARLPGVDSSSFAEPAQRRRDGAQPLTGVTVSSSGVFMNRSSTAPDAIPPSSASRYEAPRQQLQDAAGVQLLPGMTSSSALGSASRNNTIPDQILFVGPSSFAVPQQQPQLMASALPLAGLSGSRGMAVNPCNTAPNTVLHGAASTLEEPPHQLQSGESAQSLPSGMTSGSTFLVSNAASQPPIAGAQPLSGQQHPPPAVHMPVHVHAGGAAVTRETLLAAIAKHQADSLFLGLFPIIHKDELCLVIQRLADHASDVTLLDIEQQLALLTQLSGVNIAQKLREEILKALEVARSKLALFDGAAEQE